MSWRPVALVPALLLAACSSALPSATNAARGVRSSLTKQGVQVTEVRCARLHRATYGCAARVGSGNRYVCLISVGAPAACSWRNWSADDEGAFFGGCSGMGAGDGYCVCALGKVMRKHPDPIVCRDRLRDRSGWARGWWGLRPVRARTTTRAARIPRLDRAAVSHRRRAAYVKKTLDRESYAKG